MKKKLDLASRVKIMGVLSGGIIFILLAFTGIILYRDRGMWHVATDAGILILIGALFLTLLVFGCFFLMRPFSKTVDLLQKFNKGAIMEELFSMPYPFCQEESWSLEKLHQLLDARETLRLSVEQSRYMALHNQINPHFLYNTLDSIRGDALVIGSHEIAKTTEALSTFFGYSVSNLDKYAMVTEEVENVRDYMIIQQYRFGENLRLEVVDKYQDEAAWRYYMPRMTLQPLVENAIYHGLEGKTNLGTVSIQIYTTTSGLFVEVADDGVGMEAIQVDRLNASMRRAESGHTGANQRKGGIAMKNVNSRIKLLFGEQYGLHIFSELGLGTKIRISLPIMEKGALENEGRVFKN